MTDSRCAYIFDADHPQVREGEIEPGTRCDQLRFKNKKYCVDHCAEFDMLTKGDMKKHRVAKSIDEKQPEVEVPGGGALEFLFTRQNFNAQVVYDYIKNMHISKGGENLIEMYVYASWLISDTATRYPDCREALAEILLVDEKRFAEWDQNPELFVSMRNLKRTLVNLVGDVIYLNGIVMDMMSNDPKVAQRAREVYGRKIYRGESDDGGDEWAEFPEQMSEQMSTVFKYMEEFDDVSGLKDDESAVQGHAVLKHLAGNA